MNIINIINYDVIERTQGKDKYIFTIRYIVEPTSCPHCHRDNPRVHRFGKKAHVYKDLPIHGKRVELRVMRARYRCLECKRTFYEELPEFDDKRRATTRFIVYIQEKSLIRTFVSLADEVGVDEHTIRNIFKDYIKSLEKTFIFETPEWLGIDEVFLLNKPRGVMANVKENTIFDIMESRNQEAVIKRLWKIKDRDKIKLVAMDMWEPYKNAVKVVLPQAVIVVDKFHVLKMANNALEIIRKKVRDKLTKRQRRQLMHDRFILLHRKRDLKFDKLLILEHWLNYFPDLKAAYELKEEIFDIWDKQINSIEAKKQYARWKSRIPENIQVHFGELTTALTNWETEVFAYFDYRATNAYTESLNGLTKLANRIGRGYSFDVIRAKMLYSANTQKKPKKPKPVVEEINPVYKYIDGYEYEVSYGADISVLELQLESLPPSDSTKIEYSTRKGRVGRRPKVTDSPLESE